MITVLLKSTPSWVVTPRWAITSPQTYVVKHVLLVRQWWSDRAIFPAKNGTNSQTNKTCFALITHLRSVWAITSYKMLINNKFEAHTLTGNVTGHSRCDTLASRALNMSRGQSAHLIKRRCVDKDICPEDLDIIERACWVWLLNVLLSFMDSLYLLRDRMMHVLSHRTVFALTRVLFWCPLQIQILFPGNTSMQEVE